MPLVGGAFTGSLDGRSASGTDGFIFAVDASGAVSDLVQIGGPGVDVVTGVAFLPVGGGQLYASVESNSAPAKVNGAEQFSSGGSVAALLRVQANAAPGLLGARVATSSDSALAGGGLVIDGLQQLHLPFTFRGDVDMTDVVSATSRPGVEELCLVQLQGL